MSFPVTNRFADAAMPSGTSVHGTLRRTTAQLIFISGALTTQGTTSAPAPPERVGSLAAAEQTSGGASGHVAALHTMVIPGAAIGELRRRSGLTWDQLARLFGVARRSVHFWASGKAINAAHEERLGRLLALVRHIDRGSAQATRAALLTPMTDGVIPFELLAMDQLDEVRDRLGAGPGRSMRPLRPLSPAARAARRPPPPAERVGALHDTVHREPRNSRGAKAVRIKNKR